jgi:hypothetical protein
VKLFSLAARQSRCRAGAKISLVGLLFGFLSSEAPAQNQIKGKWSAPFSWTNVGIHLHVLPNGKVLYWGRREWNAANAGPAEGLDPHDCVPRLWDPITGGFSTLPKPGFNLFCAGHTFLTDGRLLAVGGHRFDGRGERKATIFNFNTGQWKGVDDMNRGRWYPTAVTLASGDVVVSGGFDENGQENEVQQVGKDGKWRSIVSFLGMPFYPRLHLAPDGRVFMAGPTRMTQYLDTNGAGAWEPVGNRLNTAIELKEAPSVMFEVGKVIFIGGGDPPQKTAEVIDLNAPNPAWKATGSMKHARRHHNATLLPDGTVFVNGGTRGNGFNDLTQPVQEAELWDPITGQWQVLASEDTPRLYHSASVLLPDGRVLSTGGGEYRLDGNNANEVKDSRRNAQIFEPPYLFKSTAQKPRPQITNAPTDVSYDKVFTVESPQADDVTKVTWVRLSSVTHAFNASQRINTLAFARTSGGLNVTAPADRNHCPPGHYMLFLLNEDGVPSISRTIRIQ